jgi:hypothetical protein
MRVHRKCCGLDVHKRMIAACLLTEDAEGNSVVEKRLFGTMTRELHQRAMAVRSAGHGWSCEWPDSVVPTPSTALRAGSCKKAQGWGSLAGTRQNSTNFTRPERSFLHHLFHHFRRAAEEARVITVHRRD